MSHGTCPVVKIKSSHPSQGDFVEINETDFDPEKHERFDAPLAPPPAPPVPPPPPGDPDPLANLAPNWREDHGARLKSLAQAVSGRAVENKDQAIAEIEKALAAR